MTGVPEQVMDEIKEAARGKGSAFLLSYRKHRNDNSACVEEGHVAITPGLKLEEAFQIAALHPDLEDHYLEVAGVFDLAANREVENYPLIIRGCAKPVAGLN